MKALLLVALVACNRFDAPPQPVSRAHPIANAGIGSSYPLGATVMLDGSRSFDPGGAITSYHWSLVATPMGSVAQPTDSAAMITPFVPDQYGTYVVRLEVTDDAHFTDASDIRIVADGAITSVDAGPDQTVKWLDTVQLAGSVTTVAGQSAMYTWHILSRPQGSSSGITNGSTLTPTFVADAAGTYVVALDANVGNETKEDTVMITATHGGTELGVDAPLYTYAKHTDRIIYVHDVGHAEAVEFDPLTNAQVALNVGAFTPVSISSNPDYYVAVGGAGIVATIAVAAPQAFVVVATHAAPGCTAARVTATLNGDVACFPADGTVEPISAVNMTSGVVTQIPCPAKYPDVALTATGEMYMVDGASSQIWEYSEGLGSIEYQGTLTGITAPVIAIDTSQPAALTGNGLAVTGNATELYDLHTAFKIGAFSILRYEVALVSGPQLLVYGLDTGHPLKLSLSLPYVNGHPPDAKLVAYSNDEHRLIVVTGTDDGDITYTVAR